MPIEPSERAREAAEQFFPPVLWREDAIADLAQAFARFEAETRKDERERCAKVADGADVDRDAAFIIAAAIRNLGEG